MALALLASVLPRLQQLLNRNRLAYTTTGAQGGNAQGAFRFDQEIVDAAINADGHIITEAYFHAPTSLRKRFFVQSANLAHGEQLPEFKGLRGKAEWSTDGVTWSQSQDTMTADDVLDAVRSGSYVSATAFRGRHFFDESSAVILHTSPFFRFEYPAYTKTTVLQCLEQHESAIIARAISLLYKDSSNVAFEWYSKIADAYEDRIISGHMRLAMPGALPKGMRGE